MSKEQPARIRILYFNSWASCHGGSSTSLLDIVAMLDRTKYAPLVLCAESGPLADRLDEINVPYVVRSVTPLTRRNIIPFAWEVARFVRFLKKYQIDLVHANTGCWRRSLAMAAKLTKTPLVQHIRNPLKDYHSDFAFNYASRIITNSDQVGRSLQEDPKYRDRTSTIYNSVDLAKYEDDSDRRSEIGAGDRPIVGFVGQIVPRKGLATIISAMPSILDVVPDAMLVVVGCSPSRDDSYEQECRALINEKGLTAHVHFTGLRRDVPAWMRTFNVFALPTRSEPFGKVVIESMAAGCPVVASAVGGIPEIIDQPELGTLIAPDDPEGLAQAVIAFLNNPTRSAEVASRARERVTERFGLKSMVSQIEDLYEEVLR